MKPQNGGCSVALGTVQNVPDAFPCDLENPSTLFFSLQKALPSGCSTITFLCKCFNSSSYPLQYSYNLGITASED